MGGDRFTGRLACGLDGKINGNLDGGGSAGKGVVGNCWGRFLRLLARRAMSLPIGLPRFLPQTRSLGRETGRRGLVYAERGAFPVGATG